MSDALQLFHPVVRSWFTDSFKAPTSAQAKGWPAIAAGQSTLLLAPTGSGKTLAAFLYAIDRLMFGPPPKTEGVRILYLSPLKALGVDVERNLQAPIAGLSARAQRDGIDFRLPTVGVRSGDTSSRDRARMLRHPPEILITTPESLYLLLTSQARAGLAQVETVIVDEIHALAGTKRGTHLFLSMERLEDARDDSMPPLQRLGLSATQRPLDEIARLLGGGTLKNDRFVPRPVSIIDAQTHRQFELTLEVPVDDMAELGQVSDEIPTGPAAQGPSRKSIWPSIHPRLLELIKAHRTTLIFVNSRRLAERLALAINELAEEQVALAHHGSLSKDARSAAEDRLKAGTLPALVATSSLELGIDMGAIDLVVQIEAPPSVASGLQRVGRAGHQVGATSKGVFFPKYRGDLLAAATVLDRMSEQLVEETRYPRNPLDVLAQQIVAHTTVEPTHIDALFGWIRRAAPYAELPRGAFEGVLDMLSGRYPSDDFAELRPRITWDRVTGMIEERRGAKRIAVVNGGTIPDRGLYGVFLADGGGAKSRRVGELDEEMVFESRVGDVFLLGASSWRIEDITHDRVTVTPAPGEPGRMPFWHGDRPGRPAELGRAIGALTRWLARTEADDAKANLRARGLDERAADNLVQYVKEELEASGEVPSDRVLVFQTFRDEVGDWRVCILSPFGARVHAPWATAVLAYLEEERGYEVDAMWSDDGLVFRLPDADQAPEPEAFFPTPDEVEAAVIRKLPGTSLFAAHFRENAGRSLLLPKRDPRRRSPLWAQRRKSADLLKVAAEYESFPVVLETMRSCLQDVFDMNGLQEVLGDIQRRKLRVHAVSPKAPSPFAASLLFSYVASYIYEGDAPLAERRAQVLSLDHAQLLELLGEAELRALLDADVVASVAERLARRYPLKHPDQVHDLLLSLGDISRAELSERLDEGVELASLIDPLVATRRIIEVALGGELRFVAAEDAGRFRDALGVVPPPGLPEAFVKKTERPLEGLLSRYARTHVPFPASQPATRWGVGEAAIIAAAEALVESDRLLQGEFLPGGRGVEFCHPEVLQSIKRGSLARLRKQVEPVEPAVHARFLAAWQNLDVPRRGLEGLLSTIEQLQGAPLVASALERDVLPARVQDYRPGMLDELMAAGEVVWRGIEGIGPHDGRVSLYLTDHAPILAPPPQPEEGSLQDLLREHLANHGASFWADISRSVTAFPQDLAAALWSLVFSGEVTNDTLAPLRSLLRQKKGLRNKVPGRGFRSRRQAPAGTEGRWSLANTEAGVSDTERRTRFANQLLQRHGVLTREAVHGENIKGGFSVVYPILKAMEEAGRIRRGYFVAGLGATQFALPGADDRLRRLREVRAEDSETARTRRLAATDPAQPYGAALPWPAHENGRPERAAGAHVILRDGRLVAHVGRTGQSLLTFLPLEEPERSEAMVAIVEALAGSFDPNILRSQRAVLIAKIDGEGPNTSPLFEVFKEHGFVPSQRGLQLRRVDTRRA